MLIYETSNSGKVYRQDGTIYLAFPNCRQVVSNSRINGGYRGDITGVFNHCMPPEKLEIENLPEKSVVKYMELLAAGYNLEPEHTVGMLTAAKMENVAIRRVDYKELEVTAIVTGGIDKNGGRVGDPASYYELDGSYGFLGGTINIILLIEGTLPPYALVRSVITATEAKTAALQELVAPSLYSTGIATGSGTDEIVVAANPMSPHSFTDAGKHSKLGELIGIAVKDAVKEALDRQTSLNPFTQRNFLRRFERYGIGSEVYWEEAKQNGYPLGREDFFNKLNHIAHDEQLVALAVSLIHLLDEFNWGLLTSGVVKESGTRFITSSSKKVGTCDETLDPLTYLSRLFIKCVLDKILAL